MAGPRRDPRGSWTPSCGTTVAAATVVFVLLFAFGGDAPNAPPPVLAAPSPRAHVGTRAPLTVAGNRDEVDHSGAMPPTRVATAVATSTTVKPPPPAAPSAVLAASPAVSAGRPPFVPPLLGVATAAARWDDLRLRPSGGAPRAPRIKCFDVAPEARRARRERMRSHVDATCGGAARQHLVDDGGDVPVVFVHQRGAKGSGADETYFARAQSAAADTNARVIVLLLAAGAEVAPADPRVEVVSLDITDGAHPLAARAASFAPHYVHCSTNHASFELVSIQRWFVLDAFMRARGLRRVFIADSDVALLTNVTQEQLCWGECDVTLHSRPALERSGSASAHSSFWSARAVSAFTDFIWDAYTTPAGLNKLQGFWKGYRNSFAQRNLTLAGGFNDMTLGGWFAQCALRGGCGGGALVACNAIGPITAAGIFDYMRGYDNLLDFGQDELGLPFVDAVAPAPGAAGDSDGAQGAAPAASRVRVPLKSIHFQGVGKAVLAACPQLLPPSSPEAPTSGGGDAGAAAAEADAGADVAQVDAPPAWADGGAPPVLADEPPPPPPAE